MIEAITDKQWNGMISMIETIFEKCKDKEEISAVMRKLLRSVDNAD